MSVVLSAPVFTTRVPVQFICPDNQALSLDGVHNPYIFNNPNVFYIQPGSVAKIDLGLNGTTYFRGDGEFAPFGLNIQWDYLGINDYNNLAALRPYFVHFISYRNIGYYGKLVTDGPKSVKGTGDAVSTKCTFYVLSPSDMAGAQSVTRVLNPGNYSATLATGSMTGYIPSGTTLYYWITFSSLYGETDPYSLGSITAPTANSSNAIAWTWPGDTGYVEKASIYVNTVNYSSSAMLCSEVLNGQTPLWNDLVGYAGAVVSQQPPSANTAYRGYWANGIWKNEATS